MKVEVKNIRAPKDGFTHSFVKALDSALYNVDGNVKLNDIAGESGFAFRLIVHKDLCPSAMSVFDWDLLEYGARNCGFDVKTVSRLWGEEQNEVERREEAHNLIIDSVNNDVPVVTWDVATPEWELITGYDLEDEIYYGLSVTGKNVELSFEKLGRREIPILYVLAPTKAIEKSEDEKLKNVLDIIINHATGKEYCEKPDYSDGYNAYIVWAEAMVNIKTDDWESRYYLETYERMRNHAYEYLNKLNNQYPHLSKIVALYKNVHNELSKALIKRNVIGFPNKTVIDSIKNHLNNAFEYEKLAVEEAMHLVNDKLI